MLVNQRDSIFHALIGNRFDNRDMVVRHLLKIAVALVAQRHPEAATVERSVAARGRRVYVDYLQNIKGKTLASAYSARANAFAGVSTPLTWDEIEEGVTPQDFTMRNFPARLALLGRSSARSAEKSHSSISRSTDSTPRTG